MSSASRHPALWGSETNALSAQERGDVGDLLTARFTSAGLQWEDPVDWRTVEVAPPRVEVPSTLAGFVSDAPAQRLLHALGRSYSDLVRARRGDFGAPPDVVATPTTPDDVVRVLDWCADIGAACIPFGGGTSVVGGVTPPADGRPVVTLQLRALDRVLDVDSMSHAACIQAGATGPGLEEQLQRSGFTLRFYPQSFELSTLGGWIATRAGGHFATGPTHIDDLVESIDAITPSGLWASVRVPASGAGPSPDRMLLGSEGTLGVVTQAWVRVRPLPEHRAGRTVHFTSFADGATAVRALAQSELRPSGCRLLDATEAALNGVADGTTAVLVLAFESAWRPIDADLDAALGLCRDAGGTPAPPAAEEDSAAGRWRSAFLRAPYVRDALIGFGAVVETFETAVTWDRFGALHHDVTQATTEAVRRLCGDGVVTCRITHAYPDGAAPYFTVVAPGRRGEEVAQWREIKAAAAEAILAAGGTITHHHAVGRDHREWYDVQRPDVFAIALQAARRAVDPAGVMNPGVLVD